MSDTPEQSSTSFASAVGTMMVLITHELGAAAGVIGALCAANSAVIAGWNTKPELQWPLYLVGGGLFIAVAVVCRWRGRA